MTVTSAPGDRIGLATIAGRVVPALNRAADTLASIADSNAHHVNRLWHLSDADLANRGFRRPTLLDQVIRHRG